MPLSYEEATAAIGNVVFGFALVESQMGLLIAFEYSAPEHFAKFIADVLGDDQFSFGLRCNAVRKVLVRNGRSEKEAESAIDPLRKLGAIRNMLLHTGKVGFAGQGGGFLHPKKVNEFIDIPEIESLIRRFHEEHVRASAMLDEWNERVSPYARKFRALEAEVMAKAKAASEPPEGKGT